MPTSCRVTEKDRKILHQECLKELRQYEAGTTVSLILNGGERTIKGSISFSREMICVDGDPVRGQISSYNIISRRKT